MSTHDRDVTRRARRWTDDDLRAAVAAHHSWRAVARTLGLRPTSTDNIRQHVARLQLDTSHFSGKRAWSDQQLRDAVATASSWSDVLKLLNINDFYPNRTRVKGHAIRLGLDVTHLTPTPARPQPSDAVTASPLRGQLRYAASAIATAWFTVRGFATATAAESQEYDLVVAMPEGLQRVQVKSTTQLSANGRWYVRIGRRPYSLDKSASMMPYDPEEIDFFFIVTAGGALYLLPTRAVAGRIGLHIDNYSEYRVGDASSLLTWIVDDPAAR